MGGDNHAELLRQVKRPVELFVGDAERAFVSQKDFEAGVTSPNDLFKILFCLGIITSDTHMKRVIAGALAVRLVHPQFERFHRTLVASRTYHLDKSGSATNQCGA